MAAIIDPKNYPKVSFFTKVSSSLYVVNFLNGKKCYFYNRNSFWIWAKNMYGTKLADKFTNHLDKISSTYKMHSQLPVSKEDQIEIASLIEEIESIMTKLGDRCGIITQLSSICAHLAAIAVAKDESHYKILLSGVKDND